MPLYTYTCDACGRIRDGISSYDSRDSLRRCECGGELKRHGVELFALGKPAYQMKGILADGTHVPGHFAKDAKRNRKKR